MGKVRALLHDYLTDDQSGTVTSRNPIVSVNEVLRLARPRDNSKVILIHHYLLSYSH